MKLTLFVAGLLAAVSLSAQSPQQIEREILGHLTTISKTGTYSGSYDEDKIYGENKLLREKLMRFGTQPATLKYSFPKLKGEMFVATSKDGKLRIYSWDKQTGGTMHDYASVFQFQGVGGKVLTWSNDDDEESAGVFYTQIFQVAGKKGPIYLANSTFIGSSSLNGQSIRTIRINGNDLDIDAKLIRTTRGLQNSVDFSYDFFSVENRPERPIRLFFFDEAKKEFRFPVVIEDDKTPQGWVTNRFIRYRFNGTHFVKVK